MWDMRTVLDADIDFSRMVCRVCPTDLHLVLQDWDLLVRSGAELLPSSRVPAEGPHTA